MSEPSTALDRLRELRAELIDREGVQAPIVRLCDAFLEVAELGSDALMFVAEHVARVDERTPP